MVDGPVALAGAAGKRMGVMGAWPTGALKRNKVPPRPPTCESNALIRATGRCCFRQTLGLSCCSRKGCGLRSPPPPLASPSNTRLGPGMRRRGAEVDRRQPKGLWSWRETSAPACGADVDRGRWGGRCSGRLPGGGIRVPGAGGGGRAFQQISAHGRALQCSGRRPRGGGVAAPLRERCEAGPTACQAVHCREVDCDAAATEPFHCAGVPRSPG